jgi:acetyl-CoA synthetase
MNIVESCFRAPADSPAIIHQAEGGPLQTMTVGELEALTRRVAANLQRLGFQPGDAIAIIMPMTAECVAIYLGIIAAGCAVVGIADSFRPKEIATRLRIAKAKAIFTRDVMVRGGKTFPLYTLVIEAEAPIRSTFSFPPARPAIRKRSRGRKRRRSNAPPTRIFT